MNMKIIVKKPNEKAKVISTDITYVGDLKKLIDCKFYPESVGIVTTGVICAVDEDGYPNKKEFNAFIPTLSLNFPIQRMVGTMVFYRRKPVDYIGEIYDYEVDSLKDRDIEYITQLLSNDSQKKYKEIFDSLYPSIDDYLKPIITGF